MSNLTTIEGKSIATKNQMYQYVIKKNSKVKLNCSVDELIKLYYEIGNIENIRGDIAFSQACLETGFFKFGGIVNWEQNNYCGLGALDNNGNGQCATFSSPREGVTAHIQHLKAYANTSPVILKNVDPRFRFVERGISPYVEYLGIQENPSKKGWATSKKYGDKILSVLNDILSIQSSSIPIETIKSIIFDGNYVNVKGVYVNDEYYICLNDLKEQLIINETDGTYNISTKKITFVG